MLRANASKTLTTTKSDGEFYLPQFFSMFEIAVYAFFYIRIHCDLIQIVFFIFFDFADSSDASLSNGKKTVRRTTFPKELEVVFFAFFGFRY